MNEELTAIERIDASIAMLNRATPARIGSYSRGEFGPGWVKLVLTSSTHGATSVGNWPLENAVIAIDAWAWGAVLMSSHVHSWKK